MLNTNSHIHTWSDFYASLAFLVKIWINPLDLIFVCQDKVFVKQAGKQRSLTRSDTEGGVQPLLLFESNNTRRTD